MSKGPCVFLLILSCAMCAREISTAVREPAVAGQFYPADSTELTRMVTGHLAQVANLPKIEGRIIALIVPHAGLVYSGQIAAYSYKLLENSGVNKVILCGPSHNYRFEGSSVYGPNVTWRTPLGMVPCENDLCQALISQHKGIDTIAAAHAGEHCLEVQLPYLQTVLKKFRLVPVIMGRQDTKAIDNLALALEALPFDSQTVLIAATDWQHYRPAARGHVLDSVGIDCIARLDADGLARCLDEGRTEACGGGPTVAVIKAAVARGANKALILKYGDSGDISGDRGSVVGYVAAVLYQSDDNAPPTDAKKNIAPAKETPSVPGDLSPDEKKKLLDIARGTIEAQLAGKSSPDFGPMTGILARPGAAFVTLEKRGQLRGCIGLTVAAQPLHETVAYCALQAAFSDPRFRPVTAAEMKDITIEISFLTPLQKVTSLDEIVVGRDGLMISRGGYRGLLLPQVATEYGWDRDEFLRETCQKAGLPPDAYLSKDALIQKFQAIIFGEEH